MSTQSQKGALVVNNTTWDAQFLEMIEKDPVALTRMTHADFARLGGMEGSKVIMWLIMRGAMSTNIRKIHQAYYLPSMTGIATAIYENEAIDPPADVLTAHCAHMGRQLAGVEALPGTYPFTHGASVKTYRLNRFLHRMIEPTHRALFLEAPERAFDEAGLTEEERRLVRDRDWRGMIHYGVIFFMLEKLGAVLGMSNLHIYAAMRGETLEAFQQTRNALGALYSVAGKDTPSLNWDGAPADRPAR